MRRRPLDLDEKTQNVLALASIGLFALAIEHTELIKFAALTIFLFINVSIGIIDREVAKYNNVSKDGDT